MQENAYNSIDYDVPPSLSVVRDRDFKRNYPFYKSPVKSDPSSGVVNMSTSIRLVVNNTEFIDPWNSWLHFTLAPVAACYQSHYVHSLADVLAAITLIDRNGLEIERITSLNLLNSIILAEKWGNRYLESSAATLRTKQFYHTEFESFEGEGGLPPGEPLPELNEYPGTLKDAEWKDRDEDKAPSYTVPPKTYEVNIPLNLLLGIFAVDKLLPPHLVSGMEIRLDWANAMDVFIANINPNTAMVVAYTDFPPLYYTQNMYGSGAVPTYTVSDIYIVLDSYVLDTSVVAQLSEVYGTVGIPLKFQTYVQTSQTYLDDDKETRLSIPMEQSFTNATKLIATARIRAGGLSPQGVETKQVVPYFLGQPWIDNSSYSLRYNGVSYPHNPVTSSYTAYHHWLSAFGKNRLYMDVRGYSMENFLTNMGNTFVVDLNRSPYSFKIAGSAVSTESNRMSSGQRIDGTNPATLEMTLGAVPAEVWDKFETTDMGSFPRQFRTVTSWVEHERVLVVKASGNRVLS